MFCYSNLMQEMQLFIDHGVEVGSIGTSTLGKSIPYVFVGNKNGNYLIVQCAIHAREHLTALLAVCQAKYLVRSNLPILGGIYFVPMSNPDGVDLCQQGLTAVPKSKRRKLVEINGSEDFSLWKANVEGVDLNVNFDARWGEGNSNVFYKSYANYVGKCAESEAETKALVSFTNKIRPVATLSYHLKGEVVYWDFGQKGYARFRDKKLADYICKYTGYKLVSAKGSVGGYKDWCISKLHVPSFTVEVGSDDFNHPFPYSQFIQIFNRNEDLPRRLLNKVVADRERLHSAGLLHLCDNV